MSYLDRACGTARNTSLPDDSSLFDVPTAWRRPTTNISADDATTISRAAVDSLIPIWNKGVLLLEHNATYMNAMVLLDHKSASTNYRSVVTSSVTAAFAADILSQSGAIASAVEWGLAAVRAHRAYNDSATLNVAVSLWGSVNSYLVTPNDAASGSHPLKSISISKTCKGSSTAGALLFDMHDKDSADVYVEALTGFSALSAFLFEATSDTKYSYVAELTAEFLKNVMWNGTIVRDDIDLHSCAYSGQDFAKNSGKTLEAISIISTHNQSWVPFMNSLVASSIPFATWTGPDGIITEGPDLTDLSREDYDDAPRKTFFIRGLYETWERTLDPAMARYIQAFLTVQFNALRDLALYPGTNNYFPTWSDRMSSSTLIPQGQLAAIDALSSQVGFARARDAAASCDNSTSPESPNQTKPVPAATHRHSAKILAGSICAGLAFVSIILLGVWHIRRRRRSSHYPTDEPANIDRPSFAPQPFSVIHPSVSLSPRKALPPIPPEIPTADLNPRRADGVGAPPSRYARFTRDFPEVAGLNGEGGVDVHGRRDEHTPTRVVELLHAIMARLPSENAREAPPSYSTVS